jgi:hypothetical protein
MAVSVLELLEVTEKPFESRNIRTFVVVCGCHRHETEGHHVADDDACDTKVNTEVAGDFRNGVRS